VGPQPPRKEIRLERFKRLSHSIWDCIYHIVWVPKYRRKELYGNKRTIVVGTIKKWAGIKGVEILEGHAMPDHIHLCVAIPPKYSVANIVGILKGKSASEVMSFGTRQNRQVRGRRFWARGYCVSTVGLDEATVREYIRHQEEEDRRQEDLGFE
jgi:putative transposase